MGTLGGKAAGVAAQGVRFFERTAVGPVAANLHQVSRCRERTQERLRMGVGVEVSCGHQATCKTLVLRHGVEGRHRELLDELGPGQEIRPAQGEMERQRIEN